MSLYHADKCPLNSEIQNSSTTEKWDPQIGNKIQNVLIAKLADTKNELEDNSSR